MRFFLTMLFMCSIVVHAQNVNDIAKVRIMSYNIRVGKRMDQKQDLKRIGHIINRETMLVGRSEPIKLINHYLTKLSNDYIATFPAIDNSNYKILYNGVVPESIASDHKPIIVDITFK